MSRNFFLLFCEKFWPIFHQLWKYVWNDSSRKTIQDRSRSIITISQYLILHNPPYKIFLVVLLTLQLTALVTTSTYKTIIVCLASVVSLYKRKPTPTHRHPSSHELFCGCTASHWIPCKSGSIVNTFGKVEELMVWVIFSSVVKQTGNDSALALPVIQHLSCSAGATCGEELPEMVL